MVSCYATPLGGCSPVQTREHYLSRSVLELIHKAPIIDGMPGIDNPKRIGVASLASKILCDAHNHSLSHLDSAAVSFFGALQRFDHELGARSKNDERVYVRGEFLERWLLKIAFGLTATNRLAGRGAAIRDEDHMLEVLFGRRDFPKNWGLYVDAQLGDRYAAPANLAITTHLNPEGELTYLRAWCRFVPLSLALGQPDHLAPAMRRPAEIRLTRSDSRGTKVLGLKWADAKQHEAVEFTRSGEMTGWAPLP